MKNIAVNVTAFLLWMLMSVFKQLIMKIMLILKLQATTTILSNGIFGYFENYHFETLKSLQFHCASHARFIV